jgi:hypothetical protein
MWEDVKKDLRERGSGSMDWICLAQDRDQWMTLVNTVVNLRFHKIFGNSSVAEQLAASQEGLCSVELVISVLPGGTKET